MKRWILALLLCLAVVVLLSPGLIGMLAERSLNHQLERAAANDPAFDPRSVSFERGWFTSAGTHRVPLNDPRLAALLLFVTPGADARAADEPPVLIVTTRLDHGLVPVGGAGRSPLALLPALASGISTLELELADGRTLAVPGELASRINLNGSAELDYRLPPGAQRHDGVKASWSGATLGVRASADGRTLAFTGSFDDWRIDSGDGQAAFAAAKADVALEATPYGFATGNMSLRVDGLTASDGMRLESLTLDASSALDGQRVAADVELGLTGLSAPGGPFDSDARLSANGLDAATLGPILRSLQRNAPAAGGTALLAPYPDFDFDLRRLLSRGATLELERLSVVTPGGELQATLELSLPAASGLSPWTGLALAADATAEIAVGRTLVETDPFAEQLTPLVAGGFLVLDGDVYRLRADYGRGIATVNGAPLPLPLPGS